MSSTRLQLRLRHRRAAASRLNPSRKRPIAPDHHDGAAEIDRAVRLEVYRRFAEDTVAPEPSSLRSALGIDADELEESLARLAHAQHLVLAPYAGRVLMAHPFSAIPTSFRVEAAGGGYWVGCAFDAMAMPALLGEPVVIHTRCGGVGEPIRIEVRDGGIDVEPSGAVAHQLVPPARAWENIGFTCATTLIFRSEERLRQWCVEHRMVPGRTMGLDQLLTAAGLAFGHRLSPDYEYPTPAGKRRIYRAAGLYGDFWLGGWRYRGCRIHSPVAAGQALPTGHEARRRLGLTSREIDVLELLVEAQSQKRIARTLAISPHTVDNHIRSIYSKLDVRSRSGAVARALREQLC